MGGAGPIGLEQTVQLDLDAPILPGVGAAGISLGAPLREVIRANPGLFDALATYDVTGRPHPRYGSAGVGVVLWGADGEGVTQIMVSEPYRGLLRGQVGLGSSVAGIERQIGPCSEDDEDNLVIDAIPGLCFEIGATFADPAWRYAPVVWLCVYRPRRDYLLGPRQARRTLPVLIRDFVAGADRSLAQVRRIEALLGEWFDGYPIKEALDFPLRMYAAQVGGRTGIGDEELADALLYAWAQHLPEGEDYADTGGLAGAPPEGDPVSRLRSHIRGFANGINRSRRYVAEIEGLLAADFRGTALYEELSPALANFWPGGGEGLCGEDELAAEFRHVLAHHLGEPYTGETSGRAAT